MASLIHDPLTRLLAQIVSIVVVSHGLHLLGRRLGQPKVIAEVCAGIALGPSLLGLLAPDTAQALFPRESLPALQLVSQLGLILFMFMVGLELDPAKLRERAAQTVAISNSSIAVPFALGSGLALAIHSTMAPPGVQRLPFALFLGVAMSVTAFPVLARILSERRLLNSRLGNIAIACAALNDVTAWCILAFVVATARAHGVMDAVVTTALTVAYIAALVFLARPLLERAVNRITTPQGLSQTAVTGILLLLLLSSWTTELIGVHALFGAFLFGAVLPRQGQLAHALTGKIEDLVLVILLPLFFAYSGVRTQLGLLDSPSDWALCAGIIAVASLGKLGASAAAARFTGLSWRDAGAIGVLMNTRGLVELIVLNIGLDLGVLSPKLFTMIVIMALVTTFATSPLLQWLVADGAPERHPAQPPLAAQTTPGFSLLLCVADERTGRGMAALVKALADERSRVHAVHMVEPNDRGSSRMDGEREVADGALAPLLERTRHMGVPVEPVSFVSGEPARDICALAAAERTDLLVLGMHRPLLGAARIGGIVPAVLREAPCDVAVFLDRGLIGVRRALLPFLGGPNDHAALRLVQRLLYDDTTELTVLHVVQPQGPRSGIGDAVKEVLTGPYGRVKIHVVEHTSPVEAVVQEARSGYDLIVLGLGGASPTDERTQALQPERLGLEVESSLLVVGAPQRARPAAI